jgi:transposase
MENIGNTVQKGIRSHRKRHTPEEKLAIIQEWSQPGMSLEEICRKYGLHALTLYKWRKSLARGLQETGDMVPKAQLTVLQKKVDELERALGRKALEADILKKAFELKGLKLPEGM